MRAVGSQFTLRTCTRPSHHLSQRRERMNYAPRPAASRQIEPSTVDLPSIGSWGDTSVMRGRLTSSHLVGRVGELAELELASHDAEAGRPVVVLLGGDSGVGKTRLVAEFVERVEQFVVLRGEGVEQGGRHLPYAP